MPTRIEWLGIGRKIDDWKIDQMGRGDGNRMRMRERDIGKEEYKRKMYQMRRGERRGDDWRKRDR